MGVPYSCGTPIKIDKEQESDDKNRNSAPPAPISARAGISNIWSYIFAKRILTPIFCNIIIERCSRFVYRSIFLRNFYIQKA